VQIAATVDSRTAAECKARYRKLCKEVKAGKEEKDRLSIRHRLEGSETGDAGAEALEAKTDRLAQLRASRTQISGVENVAAPAQEVTTDPRAIATDASGDAGPEKQTKKLKPSERRALKKAEKAARLEARARQRVAAVAADGNDGSDTEGHPRSGTDTAAGGLGWGVIQL
jgi:hypothetical protein